MTASLAKPARPDSATLVRLLDESLHEFDRLMEIAMAEVACHAGLARDYDTLLERHRAARSAGSAFVVEAAFALAETRTAAAA